MSGDLIRAARWQYPDEIPVSIGMLPAVWRKYGDEARNFAARYPQFFGDLSEKYNYDQYTPGSYHTGKFTDEWGCVWENIHEGAESIVKGHPITSAEQIRTLQIPTNCDGRIPHGFMYLRLLDLCGFELGMELFATEQPELQMLIDKVVEHNVIQVSVAIENVGEMMVFGDDLGMQKGLAIGAPKWRRYLKPAFDKIYALPRERGKLIYMHTDGCIHEIMDDLVDCGVTMINPQIRANGLDNLVRVCRGRIPINLDLDRQLFPFTDPAGIHEHVEESVRRMYLPQGGLGLSIEIGDDVPLENMYALADAAEEFRWWKG